MKIFDCKFKILEMNVDFIIELGNGLSGKLVFCGSGEVFGLIECLNGVLVFFCVVIDVC